MAGGSAGCARRYDVSRGLIHIWRREAMRRAQSAFAPAVSEDTALESPCTPVAEPEGAIVLELAEGGRLRILASAPPALAAVALRAVR